MICQINRQSFITAGSNHKFKEGKYKRMDDDRLSKQLGDFGEQLVMFIIGRLYEHRVAYVDHVGADLIVTDKNQKKYAISVKSRVFTTDGPQFEFDNDQQTKLREFANSFELIPAVAFVCIDPIDIYKDINIDVYIIELDDFVKLANNIKGVTHTVPNKLHFSNAKSNWAYIQNHELINFHRLVLKAKTLLEE